MDGSYIVVELEAESVRHISVRSFVSHLSPSARRPDCLLLSVVQSLVDFSLHCPRSPVSSFQQVIVEPQDQPLISRLPKSATSLLQSVPWER